MQRLSIQRALAAALLCLAGAALAADYKLLDGTTLSGEAIGPNEKSVIIRGADKVYPRTAWTNFTQDALKEFAKNPKMRQYVELFIEDAAPPPGTAGADLNVPEPAAPKRPPAKWSDVKDKPELPENPGLLAGLFTSGVGWFSLVMAYAAVIYAGYEVAIFRRRPKPLVMGLSAIPGVGFFAPIAFLCMPPVKTQEESKPNAVAQAAAQHAKEEQKAEQKPAAGKKKPGLAFGKKSEDGGHGAAAPAGPKPVATAKPGAAAPAAAAPSPVKAPAPPASAKLEPAVYRKGETNINKRFIETKFAGFFKAVPAAPEKDMWLVWVTTTGGEYWSKRVVSISQTELVVSAAQESGEYADQAIPLGDIQEIHLRPQEG